MKFLNSAGAQPKLVVEATVIRACQNCGASGYKDNKYVGEICPECGSDRPELEDLGVIFNSDPIWKLKQKVLNFFRRKK